MRYTKDEKLFRLALYLQGDAGGRSLEDIQGEFEVARRTAERMCDAIGRVFPQLEGTTNAVVLLTTSGS